MRHKQMNVLLMHAMPIERGKVLDVTTPLVVMNNKYKYHVYNLSPHILKCHHKFPMLGLVCRKGYGSRIDLAWIAYIV